MYGLSFLFYFNNCLSGNTTSVTRQVNVKEVAVTPPGAKPHNQTCTTTKTEQVKWKNELSV